jgi:cytochrome b involved in lipid metabolism
MSEVKELTLQEVSEHNNKKDLYLIINDKVYDCTSFANEHPYVVSISISATTGCSIPIPEAKNKRKRE